MDMYCTQSLGDHSCVFAMASWIKVTNCVGAPKARSSHAITVVEKKAYMFGGEFEPRIPIDNAMHVFDLQTKTWTCLRDCKGDIPNPRIGVAMSSIAHTIYAFGGRDGEHEELSEFYSFDVHTKEWKLVSSGDQSPPPRSYHAMAVDVNERKIYIFGGCGKASRLNDLWCFDINTGKWSPLKSPLKGSVCVPRGGPGLVVQGGYVWVLFGFSGHELRDVHRYSLQTHEWEEEVKTMGETPSARSVFGTTTIGKYILIYGGEIIPSDSGHLGAGAFSSEVFCLDIETFVWRRIEPIVENGCHPGARGWFAFDSFDNYMLVYGGNSDTNERLDDMYLLSLAITQE